MGFSDGFRTSDVSANSVDYDRVKREAFREHGFLWVDVNHPDLTWDQRELLNQIGEKFYGKKKS